MIATVKSPLAVVGNGKLLEVTDKPGGWRTYHWKMDVPHATYLVSVAIGEFTRVTDQWRGIPVEYDVPPGVDEATARRSFGDTPKILEFYSQATGQPYPYAKYAQTAVVDYMWGGMENISATTQTATTLHDARADVDSPSEGLVAHETAHQWFGDLLTCEDWSNAWLNEGFADYFTAALRALGPRRRRLRRGGRRPAPGLPPRGRAGLPAADRREALRRPDRPVRPPHLQQGGAGAPHDPPPARRGGVDEGDSRLRRALRRPDGDHGRPPGHAGEGDRGGARPHLRRLRLRRRPPRAEGEVGLPAGDAPGPPGGPAGAEARRPAGPLRLPARRRPGGRAGDGDAAPAGGGARFPGPLHRKRGAPADGGARSGGVDPEDGRLHQARRRVGDPAHRLKAAGGEAGGDPRARRPRRRRGGDGARPRAARRALLRRPPRGRQGTGQHQEGDRAGGPPRRDIR